MPLSRRTLLAALPAGALAAAVLSPRAAAAPPGGPSSGTGPAPGLTAIVAHTEAMLVGTEAVAARPEAAPRLAALDTTARARLDSLDRAGAGELFAGLPLGTDDAHLSTTYQYLCDIALATRVPGPARSDLQGSAAVQQRVIDALVELYDDYYGDQARGYYGNWYTWEIGISAQVSRILVLLRERLATAAPGLTAAYVAAMDGYLRNGKDGDVDLDSRFHTGANLADITTGRVLQGALLGDGARVAKAVADQLTVLDTVDPYRPRHGVTDGFYADGSYLQHASVAYTGSYGRDLLGRVVQTVGMLEGSGYADTAAVAASVAGRVAASFAPVVFEGWMLDAVKGRGVSRTTTGYADAAAVVAAVTDLAEYAGPADATALRGWVKYVAERSAPLAATQFASPLTAVRYADLLADPAVPAADLGPAASHHAFHAMDRTVHRRPGWTFALARTSTRVSAYEYMSGENLLPWFQGQGCHQLHLSGQDQQRAFGVDHWATVSPYRLAGVTAPVETRRSVPALYGTDWYDDPDHGFTSSSEAQNAYVYFPRSTNAYSGGAALGPYGAVGMVLGDDAACEARRAGLLPDGLTVYENAAATKSWFLFDDEIAVLAAGVAGRSGRAVTTTADTRVSDPSAEVGITGALRDGTPFTGTGRAPLAWLRYTEDGTAVGYVFPAAHTSRWPDSWPVVRQDTVTASRRDVRTANPDTRVTKRVFSVGFEQGAGAAPAALAYLIVPHATEHGLAAASGAVAVLANTPRVQAVAHPRLGLTAVNTFTPGSHRVGGLTVEGPASVLVRRAPDGSTTVAVADPTTARASVAVTLHGRRARTVAADEGVAVRRVRGGTRIEATTRQAYGRSLTARVR